MSAWLIFLLAGRLPDMIDEFAKEYLHDNLRWARTSLLGKLDGLSEYDVRRPSTRTGTNLLGLVKHLTLCEARYFGAIFDRPYPEQIPTFDDPGFDNRDHMWVTERESRTDIITSYRRACEHADATIEALPIDATGYVPWWPRPNVKLFNVMVHVVTETNRRLGHADILREQLDGALGSDPTPLSPQDEADWATHRAKVEKAAQAAATSSDPVRTSAVPRFTLRGLNARTASGATSGWHGVGPIGLFCRPRRRAHAR